MNTSTQHDVVILGGGLAGLCLSLQLRERFPDIDVVVLERKNHPLPLAAHKVGESTVEIGANYFANTLGLYEHLESAHIHKFGFRFFFSEGHPSCEQVTELGVSTVLPTTTYQVDRGILENFLGEEALRRGVKFHHGAPVRGLDLGKDGEAHTVRATIDGTEHTLTSRWVIDAAGRASPIKRKLDLAEANGHNANAVWFRIDDMLDIDAWHSDEAWLDRCMPRERWRSTNHLCGPGYWVWLIPLGSGAHSVGIVCDGEMHPIETMNTFERALEWLHKFQPLVGQHVESRREKLMDFMFLRGFSHGCKQVFSGDRWALTGEAGVFLDPFYSPGSDFIAISNTYVTELIALDRADKPLGPYARIYEQLYFSFYENTLSLYRGQYPIFGDAEVMSIKVIWDYTYYWGVLCQIVFQNRLTDIALLGELRTELTAASKLNLDMQAFFLRWYAASPRPNDAVMFDQRELAWFVEMNRTLLDPLDETALRARFHDNFEIMRNLAATIVARATAACPQLEVDGLPTEVTDATPLFAHAA